MTRPVKIFVDPTFRKKLKKSAAEEDISMIDLTRRIGTDDQFDLLGNGQVDKKPKRRFSLDF